MNDEGGGDDVLGLGWEIEGEVGILFGGVNVETEKVSQLVSKILFISSR